MRFLMPHLEHALAKIAFQPRVRCNPSQKSGALRKKFGTLRNTVGDFIGSDILRALVAEPHIVACLGALKIAAFTYMIDAYDVAAAAL